MVRSFTINAAKKKFRIGVIGYSDQMFNRKLAREKLEKLVNKALKHNKDDLKVQIVSGLTDIGIPGVAYKFAVDNKYSTAGYACKKCKDYPIFPVDDEHVVGSDWGDESEEFLNNIDVLIALGGGKQTAKELEQAEKDGKPTYQDDLKALHSLCLMGFLHPDSAKALKKHIGKIKGQEVFGPDDYHVTIRYWTTDPEDKEHQKNVIEYLKERFAYPVAVDGDIEGDTDVFGNEKSFVLHVKSEALTKFQKEIDEKLQKLGAPPSDYADYRPHITVGEVVEGKPKIGATKVLISRWILTRKESRSKESKTIWESKNVYANSKGKTVIASFDKLSECKNVEEVLDFMIFKTSPKVVDQAVFDHLLFSFFSRLPSFQERNDFSEDELETFKEAIPFEELGLNREKTLANIKRFRSINRVLDEVVDEMSDENKSEIAREYIRTFWFDKVYGGDVAKFVSALKPEFWTATH